MDSPWLNVYVSQWCDVPQMHQQMAAKFKDLSEGWFLTLAHDSCQESCFMTGWTHQPVTFFGSCKGLSLDANKSPHHWPWESAFRWIKRRAFLWFGRSHLTMIISAGNDLEGQLWLSLGYVTYDDYFQGLYIVSNCSWWQKSSAWLCRNQSRSLTDINLDECTSWSLLRVCRWAAWVTSPPQWASCGSGLWGALQLVSMCTTWFLAEWTDSCWQEKASSCLQNSWWGWRKLRSEH